MKSSLFILISFVFFGCLPKIQQVEYRNNSKELFSSKAIAHPVDTMIQPYRVQLEQEMNTRVGEAACTMTKERPEGTLGNFAADLLLEYGRTFFADSASNLKIIALLNHGGLRAPINAGPLLLRNVYELMPFDNEIVLVKIKQEKFEELYAYLEKVGGEPIAGYRKGDAAINSDFWIVTSNYLAEGGDKMTFFLEPLDYVLTGRMLRDEFISYIQKQGSVCSKLDKRWY